MYDIVDPLGDPMSYFNTCRTLGWYLVVVSTCHMYLSAGMLKDPSKHFRLIVLDKNPFVCPREIVAKALQVLVWY